MKYQDPFEPETFYHIFNHAVGSENLFRTDDNYQYFLKKYAEHTESVWETYAYCLMPNHFHFLIKVKPIQLLQQLPKFSGSTHKFVMQKLSNFLNAYAKAYNIKYQRKGALFLDYTRRVAVKEDSYFTTLINYIHQNPVHHGYCKSLDEWKYSSYQAHISEKATKLQREHVLNWFGGKAGFERFHKENLAALQDDLEFLS
jgi:REP element-mobilizing transposase RayT